MPARPRKRFGQHFLTDAAVVERIFAALALKQSDAVLEIGPGTGVLTGRLASEAASLAAIEIDRDLAAALRARFPAVDVVCADALTANLDDFLGAPGRGAQRRPVRIVGNLPYNVATPLLDRLFSAADRVADMHFMLQAEVAERLTAPVGVKRYGRLSVIAQYHCRIERLFGVDAESFTPTPKVRSAFVRFTARVAEPCDIEGLRSVLRAAFGQRRKTLANALKSSRLDWQALNIDPGARAENLRVQDFVAIANHMRSRTVDAPKRGAE